MAFHVGRVSEILASAYDMRKEIVPCFIGAPGIGKTEGIRQFAESQGVGLVTFILSNTIPSEVSGIRMPDQDTKKLEVFDDSRMASLKDGDILFFDEFLEAPRELWSACLTLIQNRIMASGRPLPDVMIVAASNPVASPRIIPASVRDRFQMIEVEANWELWKQWFVDKFGKEPNDSLSTYIQTDSDTYNILTPRRIVKLYQWYESAEDKDLVFKLIEDMFQISVAIEIRELAKRGKPFKRVLKEELWRLDVPQQVIDELDGLSLKEIVGVLNKLDNWDEIQNALSQVEWKEEE